MPSSFRRIHFSRHTLALAAGLAIGASFMAGCGDNPYDQGERIYVALCSNCHMEDGSGLGKLIPALTAERLTLDQPQRLICLIKRGLPRNPMTNQQMPAQPEMSVTEMTNLINYLGYVHAGREQSITLDEVIRLEGACQTR
jgi:mono/diheme cytochrome c family protein